MIIPTWLVDAIAEKTDRDFGVEAVTTTEKRVPVWKGQRLENLTREELIEAYTWAVETIESERRWNQHVLEVKDEFDRALRR